MLFNRHLQTLHISISMCYDYRGSHLSLWMARHNKALSRLPGTLLHRTQTLPRWGMVLSAIQPCALLVVVVLVDVIEHASSHMVHLLVAVIEDGSSHMEGLVPL